MAGLAPALSIKVRGWGLGLANRSEGSGGRAGRARSGTAQPLADTAQRGLARNIPDIVSVKTVGSTLEVARHRCLSMRDQSQRLGIHSDQVGNILVVG